MPLEFFKSLFKGNVKVALLTSSNFLNTFLTGKHKMSFSLVFLQCYFFEPYALTNVRNVDHITLFVKRCSKTLCNNVVQQILFKNFLQKNVVPKNVNQKPPFKNLSSKNNAKKT